MDENKLNGNPVPLPEQPSGIRLWMENGRMNITISGIGVELAQAMLTMAQIEIANRIMHANATPSGLVIATGGLPNART